MFLHAFTSFQIPLPPYFHMFSQVFMCFHIFHVLSGDILVVIVVAIVVRIMQWMVFARFPAGQCGHPLAPPLTLERFLNKRPILYFDQLSCYLGGQIFAWPDRFWSTTKYDQNVFITFLLKYNLLALADFYRL